MVSTISRSFLRRPDVLEASAQISGSCSPEVGSYPTIPPVRKTSRPPLLKTHACPQLLWKHQMTSLLPPEWGRRLPNGGAHQSSKGLSPEFPGFIRFPLLQWKRGGSDVGIWSINQICLEDTWVSGVLIHRRGPIFMHKVVILITN